MQIHMANLNMVEVDKWIMQPLCNTMDFRINFITGKNHLGPSPGVFA